MFYMALEHSVSHVRLLNAYNSNILLYGSETWKMIKSFEQILDAFHVYGVYGDFYAYQAVHQCSQRNLSSYSGPMIACRLDYLYVHYRTGSSFERMLYFWQSMLFAGQSWKIRNFSDLPYKQFTVFNINNDLGQKFIKEYSIQTKQGKTIALCWIPSHVGIPWNEKADSAAKGGLSLTVTALKSPASELLPRITELIYENLATRQQSWNNCTGKRRQ